MSHLKFSCYSNWTENELESGIESEEVQESLLFKKAKFAVLRNIYFPSK